MNSQKRQIGMYSKVQLCSIENSNGFMKGTKAVHRIDAICGINCENADCHTIKKKKKNRSNASRLRKPKNCIRFIIEKCCGELYHRASDRATYRWLNFTKFCQWEKFCRNILSWMK